MLKSYFRVAYKNILKQKGYSFINVLGLAMGMAVCILIFLWVQDELSFDRFHKNADQIYRVVEDQLQSTGEVFPVAVTPWPLGEALKLDYPEVIDFARYLNFSKQLVTYRDGDKSFFEDGVCVADPSFLKIFSFPLIKGDASSVIITENIAKKYFGKENPIGKTLTFQNRVDYLVSGVLKNLPSNSHLKFDLLLPLEATLKNSRRTWFTNYLYTYILLKKDAAVENVQEKIHDYLVKRYPNVNTRFNLQRLNDIHLHSSYAIDLYGASKDSSLYIYIFSIVAIIILLIACINFINLAIARSSTRAKEIGLRKVVGANRMNLMVQFYGESIFFTFIAWCFAVVLVVIFLAQFNQLTGKDINVNPFTNFSSGIVMLIAAILTAIIAGTYPAIFQSSFQPVNIIKGSFISKLNKSGSTLFRKVLVIFQFTLSIGLIIGTFIVSSQLNFLQNKELGYEKSNMIYFKQRGNFSEKYSVLKEELLKNPDILNVTSSSDVPIYSLNSTSDFEWEGKNINDTFLIHQFSVDVDYIKTFKIKIVEGRDFSKKFAADIAGESFILNETAVKAMGISNPIGKRFGIRDKEGYIVGVVKDFHYKSLHNKVEPLVLRVDPSRDLYVFMKIKKDNLAHTINYIKNLFETINPNYPFEYDFIEDQLNHLYDKDRRTVNIFGYFTFIAIFISCLGLFGLASFLIQRRSKEIGIRKVLGASISNIVLKLSKEFLLLVGIANIIAWPIAYIALSRWLQNFAYRTNLDIGVFILSAFMTLIIAFLTVIYQSIKAATANPVNAIRYE